MQSDDLAKRSTDSLVSVALQCESDDHRRWDAIQVLQDRGSREVFDVAARLCTSPKPADRCLGADLLAQGRSRSKTLHEEAVTVLLQMLERETDPNVLHSIAMALGHRKDSRAIAPLAELRSHPNPDVRCGVVFGILGHEDKRAVQTLIELSADDDSDVRDWATFGLGTQVSSDTPAIRDALVARLTDSDPNTRAEAIVGLARRHDERMVPALVEDIHDGWEGSLIREAVEASRHPEVLRALADVREQLSDEARAWAEDILSDAR